MTMEYQIKSSHIQRHLHLLCQIPDALRAGDDVFFEAKIVAWVIYAK